MSNESVSPVRIERVARELCEQATTGGYHLNPNNQVVEQLVEGLLVNEQRYGYRACPCRLADGDKDADLDIICPCEYRDADVQEFGTCYCGLYVSEAVADARQEFEPIPERRPAPEDRKRPTADATLSGQVRLSQPVWRCRVCGYLCAREMPPAVCPICKAKQERFERFI